MKHLVMLFLSVLMLTSCSGDKREQESGKMHAYRLIDAGRVDEAIVLLEQSHSDNPDNVEVTVTLASAYARKAGVRIQTLAPSVFAIQKLNQLKAVDTNDTKEPTEIGRVFFTFSQFSDIWSIYAAIPKVTPSELDYLTHAIELMDENADSLAASDHVYRAILKTVFLKSLLERDVLTDPDAALPNLDVCKLDFTRLQVTLEKISAVLSDVIDDVAIASPSEKVAMMDLKDRVTKNISATRASLTSLSSGDVSIQNTIREMTVARGFSKILQCASK